MLVAVMAYIIGRHESEMYEMFSNQYWLLCNKIFMSVNGTGVANAGLSTA